MIDCSKEMTGFHDGKVTLPRKEQTKMRKRRDTNRDRLKKGLDKNNDPKSKGCWAQGSYIMRTMVLDPQNDYDIDDGVYFDEEKLKDAEIDNNPRACREMVCDAITSDKQAKFKKDPEVKNNCVRIHYAEGYHIDIPVYKVTPMTDDKELFGLASGDEWTESDAKALNDWFRDKLGELKSGKVDHSQMRRVVRYSKKFARRTETDGENWKDQMTSGICITKLVVDNFKDVSGRDDESLYDTWEEIEKELKKSLRVEHPLDSTKTLSKGNDDDEVRFFKEKISWALGILKKIKVEKSEKDESLETWDEVFNTSYFSEQIPPKKNSDNNSGSGLGFFGKANDSTKRDDRGGRYGSYVRSE